MTAPVPKAAPIPADDAVNTVAGILALNYGREYVTGRDLEVAEEIVAALAGGQEERIREDERDALFLAAERAKRRHIRSWIGMRGGMFPADRARQRGDAS